MDVISCMRVHDKYNWISLAIINQSTDFRKKPDNKVTHIFPNYKLSKISALHRANEPNACKQACSSFVVVGVGAGVSFWFAEAEVRKGLAQSC